MMLASTRPALDLATLTRRVSSVAADTALWAPRVRFVPSGRWWARIAGDDAADVWLLTWLRDQETDIHDHGGSSAAFTVVAGALRELRPQGFALTEHRHPPGETVWVPPGVVHGVGNPWKELAVSIHAYSPPLTTMTYYRRAASGLVATETRLSDSPER